MSLGSVNFAEKSSHLKGLGEHFAQANVEERCIVRTYVPVPEEAASLIGSKADDYLWRATERKLGSIKGVKSNLVLIDERW